MGNLEFYENEINNSPIFELDREKEPSAYEREKNRLIENIYLYKMEENPANEEFGLEIVETVGACLGSFEKGKGVFLHYFNSAFAKNKKKAGAAESLQKRSSGIHFTQKEKDQSKAIHDFLSKHENLSVNEFAALISQYADQFDMDEDELAEALRTYLASMAKSGNAEMADEEGYTLFDTLAGDGDFTEEYMSNDMVRSMIQVCDQCYEEAREGTKEFLAIKLTALFTEWDRHEEFAEDYQAASFFHQKTHDYVYASGKKLKNKEISTLLNKSEANLTQTWKRFQEKLRTALQEL